MNDEVVYKSGFIDLIFFLLKKYFKAGIIYKIVFFIPVVICIVVIILLAFVAMYFYIRLQTKMQ